MGIIKPPSPERETRAARPGKGWPGLALVLTLTLLVLLLGTVSRVLLDIREVRKGGTRRTGTLESYGFDLSNATVKRELLSPSNQVRDRLEAMYEPQHISVAELQALNKKRGGKYLLSHDRVIGVQVGSESRAYPIQVLNWHEVVNDNLGGLPVAVTYNGLADCAITYSRSLGGETLTLAVSGIVYNSNSLLYDRQSQSGEVPAELSGQESLWSQCGGMAVSGPRAGQQLEAIPSKLLLWKDWLAAHPNTTVLSRYADRLGDYKKDVYRQYFQTDKLEFVVWPQATIEDRVNYGLADKTRCLLLSSAGESWLVPWDGVLNLASYDADGLGRLSLNTPHGPLDLLCRKLEPGALLPSVWAAESQASGFEQIAAGYFFAFNTLRPGFEVLPAEAGTLAVAATTSP
jgi:hypothetical protein